MVQFMKDFGITICIMGVERFLIRMEIHMRVNSRMIRLKGSVSTNMLMATNT